MGDFDPAFVHALSVQSWSFYSVGMFLILLRVYARIHRLGIRNLQKDDFLMIWAACLYTILIVCLNVISGGGGSNLYPPEQYATFTPQDIKERIKGSKIVIVSEQAMLNVIYTIKACMLLMYTRLTLGLQIQRMVLYLAIYVLLGFIATEIAFFTACTPFKGYWAVPPPNPQCTTLQNYAIIQACFNISSDTLMLFIPLPLITRLNVPWKQKSVLFVIFGMGLFVIIAAILTKVFNLLNIWDPQYMLWYTREASVAVYVSNLPMIWPLLREHFPGLRSLAPGAKSSSQRRREGYTGREGGLGRSRTTVIAGRHVSGGFGGGRRWDDEEGVQGGSGLSVGRKQDGNGSSTEELSMEMDGEGGIVRMESWEEEEEEEERKNGITMTTTVQISEEHVELGRAGMAQALVNPSLSATAVATAVVNPGNGNGNGNRADLENSNGNARGLGHEKGNGSDFDWGFKHERLRR